MEQISTFSTDVNTALILINQRRQIFFSNTHPYAKLIALAIAEHMTCTCLEAFPTKSRVRMLTGIPASTFEKYWPEAASLFDVEARAGRSSVLRYKLLMAATEIAELWSSKAPHLRVVGGRDHTHPTTEGGSPTPHMTPPQIDPPHNSPPTHPTYGGPKRYIRDITTQYENAREKVTQEAPPLTAMAASVAMGILALGSSGDPAAACPVDPPAIVQQVSEAVDLDALMVKLEGAAGAALRSPATAPGLLSLAAPLRWIEHGCDLEKDILPTVRARSAGKRASIASWEFFTQAVADARASRLRGMPEGTTPAGRDNRPRYDPHQDPRYRGCR